MMLFYSTDEKGCYEISLIRRGGMDNKETGEAMINEGKYMCPYCDKELSFQYFQLKPRKMLIKACPHCKNKLSFDAYYGIPLKPLTHKQIAFLVLIIFISYGLLLIYIAM